MSKFRIGRYAFDLAAPLPDLSRPWGDAYAGEVVTDHPEGVYALLLNHKLPTRTDLVESLEGAKAGALQSVLAYEVVMLPAGPKLGYVLTRPPGPSLVSDLSKHFQNYKEDAIRNLLVAPLFSTLVTLHERTVYHGSISPLTIYGTPGMGKIMLAECVTLPAGYRQPALFESIERAQCQPEGKGESGTEDDLFALGVTAYLMALGHNPFHQLPDEELIRARLEIGSSTLMLNYAKLPSTILELVRGLCGDNGKQRWSLNELDNWIAGQRVAPRNVTHVAKASRALPFNGKEFSRARSLAAAIDTNPPELRKLVDSKELLRWLNRSLGDHALYEEVHRLVEKTNIKQLSDEMLTARIAMLLDPQGPLRFKGVQVMPAALGTAVAQTYVMQDSETQKILAEIISSDLVNVWTTMPGNGSPFLLAMAKEVDRVRDYLAASGMGNGLERVVYELQPSAPCYSDIFSRHYVLGPKQILPILDDVASQSHRPHEPLDRHMSAFLAARMGRGKETIFSSAQTNKSETSRSLAALDVLSQVQNRYSVDPVPRLSAWILENLRPVLDRFHNRTLRQNLQQNLSKIAAQGELDVLHRAIDSPQVVEGDLRGFKDAMRQYRHLQEQIHDVTVLIDNKQTVGMAMGHRLAAALAVMISMVAVAAALTIAVR